MDDTPTKTTPPGLLYMIPCTLGPTPPEETIPEEVLAVTRRLRHFLAENPKSARRYLKVAKTEIPLDHLIVETLDKRTAIEELPRLFKPIFEGHDMGVISEAGMPGVADPGADAVRFCHDHGIRVVPMVGPSSILLALSASGLGGQQFTFHGYLTIDKGERAKMIKQMVHHARSGYTQIFMETPFRNDRLMEEVLRNCPGDVHICVAADISLPDEFIQTKTVSEWKKSLPKLHKRPAMFLLAF